jgi:hypothetical protein
MEASALILSSSLYNNTLSCHTGRSETLLPKSEDIHNPMDVQPLRVQLLKRTCIDRLRQIQGCRHHIPRAANTLKILANESYHH